MAMHLESGVTLRRDLTVVAQEYSVELAQQGYIGLRVAPQTPVGQKEATYPVISRENFLKPAVTARAPGARYNRIDGTVNSRSFACQEHGLEGALDDSESKRYAAWLDFEQAKTQILMGQIRLAHERRIAALVMDSAVYTPHSRSVSWATAATAVPLTDIRTGIDTIRLGCGIPPAMMSLIVSYTNFLYMQASAQVIDQVKYTWAANQGVRPANIPAQAMADILGIKEVLVGMAGYDTTEEGVTTSMSGIWSNSYAMVAVLGQTERLEEPAAWRTLLWTEDSPELPVVEAYRDEPARSDIVRVRHSTDEVACADANLLAYLIGT